MTFFTDMNAVAGTVVSRENPYVKILAKPVLEIHEPLPGIVIEQWTALAQVEGSLCVVELKVTEAP